MKLHSWNLTVPHSHKVISRPKNTDVIVNRKKIIQNALHAQKTALCQWRAWRPDGSWVSYKCYSQGSGGGGRGGGGSSVAAAAAAFACAASFVIDLVILPLRRPWLLAVFRPLGVACSLSSVSSGATSVLSFSLVFSLEVVKIQFSHIQIAIMGRYSWTSM